jgi:SRSO17 transposase
LHRSVAAGRAQERGADGSDHPAGACFRPASIDVASISQGGWSEDKILDKAREMVAPEMEWHGPIEAWIIDDTGFPKQGKHSVGVARQYCGQLGKTG